MDVKVQHKEIAACDERSGLPTFIGESKLIFVWRPLAAVEFAKPCLKQKTKQERTEDKKANKDEKALSVLQEPLEEGDAV